jgi:hypothetical protein
MTTRSEAVDKIRSLLTDIEEKKCAEDRGPVALNLFQYLAQPEILQLFDDNLSFRRTVMNKIQKFRMDPYVQQNLLFASAFTTIEKGWRPRNFRHVVPHLVYGWYQCSRCSAPGEELSRCSAPGVEPSRSRKGGAEPPSPPTREGVEGGLRPPCESPIYLIDVFILQQICRMVMLDQVIPEMVQTLESSQQWDPLIPPSGWMLIGPHTLRNFRKDDRLQ